MTKCCPPAILWMLHNWSDTMVQTWTGKPEARESQKTGRQPVLFVSTIITYTYPLMASTTHVCRSNCQSCCCCAFGRSHSFCEKGTEWFISIDVEKKRYTWINLNPVELTRPYHRINTLCCPLRNHDENILNHWLVDRDEHNVADNGCCEH